MSERASSGALWSARLSGDGEPQPRPQARASVLIIIFHSKFDVIGGPVEDNDHPSKTHAPVCLSF